MVKEHPLSSRNRAIGMLEAGFTQRKCAKLIGPDISTIRRWWSRYKKGESLQNIGGRGPKSSIPRVVKIILAKSISKRNQSTRKLPKRITASGFHITHGTVYNYLRKTLQVKPYKRQRHPLLNEKQLAARLNFCKERRNWNVEDWKRVLFSDESPFEILHPPNRQNDRIWAKDTSQIPPVKRVKFLSKIHVWGMMSYCALSEFHIVPKGQTITAGYYAEEILKNSLLSAMRRKRNTGNVLSIAMLPEMSKSIFQQDGAPAHHAKISQEWCKSNLKGFWAKGIWPGNSPDLNPIENLWSILQTEVDTMAPSTNTEMLIRKVKLAWSQIQPDILDKMYRGMPERIKKCIKLKGGYIGK